MLIQFFKSGTGGGLGPVGYLIADKVRLYDENRDLVRRADGEPVMVERHPKPTVLRGDSSNTTILIDACRHKWTYRSGVLSFTRDDGPNEDEQNAAMDAFEALAFAGLERGQYDCLWVRHQHEDRIELHFCTVRQELRSGKSLNIAPPGYQKDFDALRDHLNKTHGWADPEDPERASEAKPVVEDTGRAKTREQLHDWITDRIAEGLISDRNSMIAALVDQGFEVPRAGQKYITALDSETGERMRLKGTFFHEDWTIEKQIDREVAAESAASGGSGKRLARCSAEDLHRRYRKACEKRAAYNRERYRSVRSVDGPEGGSSRQTERDLGGKGSAGERDGPRGQDGLAEGERDVDCAADGGSRDLGDGGQPIGDGDHTVMGHEDARRPISAKELDVEFPWRAKHDPNNRFISPFADWRHRFETDFALRSLTSGGLLNADAARTRIANLRRRADACLRSLNAATESVRKRTDRVGAKIDGTDQACFAGYDLLRVSFGRLAGSFDVFVASLHRWWRERKDSGENLGRPDRPASRRTEPTSQGISLDKRREIAEPTGHRPTWPSP